MYSYPCAQQHQHHHRLQHQHMHHPSQQSAQYFTPMLIVHGGCGYVAPGQMLTVRSGVKDAATAGHKTLLSTGNVLDAVEEAVANMELNSAFNAGLGSVLTWDGTVEMEAAIMNGANLDAGCVSVVRDIENPIKLARRVMEKTRHRFLVGEGAMKFAEQEGFKILNAGTLVCESSQKALEKYKENFRLVSLKRKMGDQQEKQEREQPYMRAPTEDVDEAAMSNDSSVPGDAEMLGADMDSRISILEQITKITVDRNNPHVHTEREDISHFSTATTTAGGDAVHASRADAMRTTVTDGGIMRTYAVDTAYSRQLNSGDENFASSSGLNADMPFFWNNFGNGMRSENELNSLSDLCTMYQTDQTVGELAREETIDYSAGTVGAVAIDAFGNVAAATSTGGSIGKLSGRIGDSSILGAGTYADNASGAISATGHGETIMRYNLASRILAYLQLHGMSIQQAVVKELDGMTNRFSQTAGVISISSLGQFGIHFTTQHMPWAYQRGHELHYGVERNEDNVEYMERPVINVGGATFYH